MSEANLSEARLRGAYLYGANLKGARVTPEQLALARSLRELAQSDDAEND